MREIKFRGKRVDNGEWAYGGLIECSITGKKYIFPLGSDANESSKVGEEGCLRIATFEVIPETVGQFTGLKDKNGKEIYEGDILTTENGTFSNTGQGYVRIYKGGFVSFYGQDTLNRDCFDELYNVCDEREIIGSIYENPELMEENNENNND